jgi:hypothetical protein
MLLCFILLIVIVMMMCETTYDIYIFKCSIFNHHWMELGFLKCI